MKECPKELIDAHWGYVASLLLNHGVGVDDVSVGEFHYKSAFAHGWKHAKEDSENDKQPGEIVKDCETCLFDADSDGECHPSNGCCVPMYVNWAEK